MTLTRAPVGSLLKQPLEQRKKPKTPVQKRDGKDEAYLALVRQLPCAVCGYSCYGPSHIEAHHLKQGTGERGMAKKSSDKWALPLCAWPDGGGCHGEIERRGSKHEITWFAERGIDCLTLAASLHANKERGLEEMLKVLRSHRST